jgi:polysaccharide pyruvyl transferase WcaK-like protein
MQILEEDHDIVATFDHPIFYTNSLIYGFIEKIVPRRVADHKYLVNVLDKVFCKLLPFLSGRRILYRDVNKTAELLLKYRSKSSEINQLLLNIENTDAIVINGEGSMIFSKPTRIEVFYFFALIKIAKEKGKKALYINGMASKCPVSGFDIEGFEDIKSSLQYCDLIVVRDLESYRFLGGYNIDVKLEYLPDALFSWFKYFNDGLKVPQVGDTIIPFPEKHEDFGRFNFNEPYICISGSSFLYKKGLNSNKDIIDKYVKLVQSVKKLGLKIYLVETCKTDSFLNDVSRIAKETIIPYSVSLLHAVAILGNAQILIGGRYHPGIMASLGGTPCMFFDSNSHKTKSLQEILKYKNIQVFSSDLKEGDISKIYDEAHAILKDGLNRRKEILDTTKSLALKSKEINYLISKL